MKTIEAVQCEHCGKLHPKENIYDYVIADIVIVRGNNKIIVSDTELVYCNYCLAKSINKALGLYYED